METRHLSNEFAVTGQITENDVAAIVKAGFRSLVCNRPDGEADGQPPYEPIQRTAEAAGLAFRYIPVVSGAITPENVSDMSSAVADLPRPVLAYCRTGGRCTNLFSLMEQQGG